ncbi:MAG: efflux RND transporter permease subunit [Bacteroidales bacterium]|nr:efflux RND transporter permease subunit [Bacteroidales bacterium]
MLNKIIKFSLNNRILVLLVTSFLLIGGCYVAFNTEVDVFPDLNAPTVTVMTEANGYAPEEVEKAVTFPIETVLNGATNVRRVRSSSTSGFSIVWVEFDWGTDIYRARQIVTEKLSTLESNFPNGVKSPVLGPQSSILGEMLIISLTADTTSLLELRTIADRIIRPRILAEGGVAEVQVIGGDIKEYQILVDPSKMNYFDVTMSEVLTATNGINNNIGGGILYEFGNEYLIKGDINTTQFEEIANCVVRSDSRGTVLVGDVAEVKIGSKSPKLGLASKNSQPAVLLTITKQPNTDTKALTNTILLSLEELKKSLSKDIVISTDTFRQSNFIDSSISNIQGSLIEGALFVVIVLFFFLMNARTTIISLVALPLSVLVAIMVLHLLGYTINTMSLGGIAIAIGSLVDDAIVDVENVYKRIRENRLLPENQRKSILEIVFNASAEVRMPILNSTLIIVACFLPLFFLSGLEGRLLIPLGISFIVSLVASTIVALTVTPVLCSYLLKENGDKEIKEPMVTIKLKKLYKSVLDKCFNVKYVVLTITGVMFIIALALFFTLGRSFLPSFNEGSFTVNVNLMPGISLEESDKIGSEAEKIILSIPEVKCVSRKTGRAELAEHSFGVNVSEIEAPYELTDRSKSEVLKELREKLAFLPGANIEIGQPISHRIDAMLSGSKAQIAIKLFGPDLNKLYNTGNQIKNLISTIPGIVDVNLEQQVARPQLRIRPKRDLLAKYGITINEFSDFINVTLSGIVVSQVYEDGLPYDVTLRVAEDNRNSMEKIKNLMIDSNQGKIPFSYVAEVKSSDGPNSISRENVSRRIMVSCNIHDRDLRGAVNDIQEKIDKNLQLPDGYYIVYGGQFENEAKASKILALMSMVALIIVVILLYQEFKDIKQSLIVLVNIPLALIGGVLILKVGSNELNIPAIIGFISLLGITTRNGMLLMSRYNQLKKDGVSLYDRIYKGSIDRLLPIIMTALTTALALIPIAIKSTEPGNEIQSPMAIVILGGLITSTLLNVFIVPILYYLVTKKEENC